jgi:hypothetical protein
MAYRPIGPAGSVGVNKDLSSKLLKPEAWTDALNIRFLDQMAYQFLGHGEVFQGAPIVPFHVLPVSIGGARYWIYAGLGKVYAVSGATGSTVHTDITRSSGGDYTATPNSWTSTTIGGIPVLNPGNTTDPPQRWDLNLANNLVTLDNWPANTFCRSMRSFKNQLVALNVTESGTNYPYMVWWSSLADPGSVPASWVINDPSIDAGRFDLAEGYDAIIDGLQLRDSLMIYKESSVYRLDYVGGAFINQSSKVLGTSGAMNRNCIVELDGLHLLLTNQDVVVHDGQTATSALDKQARRDLFRSIDSQNYYRSFVTKNPFLNEVLICYPQAGSTYPDRALVWNYVDRTTSFREIPNLNHANFGPVEVGSSQPWNGDDSPWSSDTTLWNAPEYTPDAARVLMASNDQKLFLLDSSTTFDGVLPQAHLERRGLSWWPLERRSMVRKVRPHIQGQVGATVMVSVGYADDPYSDPTYASPVAYTIGTGNDCDFTVDGRYIAFKFWSGTAYEWRLDSFDVDVVPSGFW